MKTILLLTSLVLSPTLLAKKSLKAHAHDGEVELKIVINADGKTMGMELEGTGDSLLGFESRPKSKFQKEVYSAVKTLWEKSLTSKLVKLDSAATCKITSTKFNLEYETEEHHDHDDDHDHGHKHKKKHTKSEHSEVLAQAEVTCANSVIGKAAMVNIKGEFNQTLLGLHKKHGKKRTVFIKEVELEAMAGNTKPKKKSSSKNSFKLNL